jgi:hypothetical protein
MVNVSSSRRVGDLFEKHGGELAILPCAGYKGSCPAR